MKKRIFSLILALCLALSLVPAALAAGDEGHSGDLTMEKLSKGEIRALLRRNPGTYAGEAMEEESSTVFPYAIGKVSQAALEAALGRFNALRRIAGLPEVSLDQELTRKAQYGAVLLAAVGALEHYPQQPADMDGGFYSEGKTATASSNIYMGTWATLPQAVDAFFDDSDKNNISLVGHRRWMLSPTMSKTGFGFTPSQVAFGSLTYNFATLWAFDRSGPAVDYDFLSWPASGSFPSDLFLNRGAWSVTLNPEKYETPVLRDLKVTVSGEQGTWTLSGTETYKADSTGAYLNVDTGNYAVANCIIFRPPIAYGYEGVYTVTISGLKTKGGAAKTLTFKTDFFRLADPEEVPVEDVLMSPQTLTMEVNGKTTLTATVIPANATDPTLTWASSRPEVATVENGVVTALAAGNTVITATAGEKTNLCLVTVERGVQDRKPDLPSAGSGKYVDVPPGSWFEEAVDCVTEKGLFQGVGNDRFDPEGSMSRAMVMTVLARLDGQDTTPHAGETWDIRGRRWAVSNRISDGIGYEDPIDLEELAVMMYRYALLREKADANNPNVVNNMADGSKVSDWAVDGVNWALKAGVLQGDENHRLNPQREATRAQVAVILLRYLTVVA